MWLMRTSTWCLQSRHNRKVHPWLVSVNDIVYRCYKMYVRCYKMSWTWNLTAAPDRTETRSGLDGSPRVAPITSSTVLRPSNTSSQRPSGNMLPFTLYSWHVSVVMVRPGGTERPMLDISARLAPFPPSCHSFSCNHIDVSLHTYCSDGYVHTFSRHHHPGCW